MLRNHLMVAVRLHDLLHLSCRMIHCFLIAIRFQIVRNFHTYRPCLHFHIQVFCCRMYHHLLHLVQSFRTFFNTFLQNCQSCLLNCCKKYFHTSRSIWFSSFHNHHCFWNFVFLNTLAIHRVVCHRLLLLFLCRTGWWSLHALVFGIHKPSCRRSSSHRLWSPDSCSCLIG